MTDNFGKNDILKWINATYQLNVSKIEQACTGALYCQILDSIHPGKVKMHKVNWKAKLEHEFLFNFKLLQQAFEDCKIAKNIEVEKLVKGKYQDNLEFLQWMKRYFEERTIVPDYEPLLRRGNQELEICNESNNPAVNKKRADSKTQFGSNTQKSKSSKSVEKFFDKNEKSEKVNSSSKNNLFKLESNVVNNIKTIRPDENSISLNRELPEEKEVHEKTEVEVIQEKTSKEEEESKLNDATDILRQHYQERLDIATDDTNKLKLEVSTLKMSLSEIGNQRDFYFSKLRDIEMLVVKVPNLTYKEFQQILSDVLFAEKEVELLFDDEGGVQLKNR